MEGVLREVANPLNPARMEKILEDALSQDSIATQSDSPDVIVGRDTEVPDDEVSIHLYGTQCQCSKRTTSLRNACACKKLGENCNKFCHGGLSTLCKNIQ